VVHPEIVHRAMRYGGHSLKWGLGTEPLVVAGGKGEYFYIPDSQFGW